MRFVKGFFRFWYDFIVGDDWKLAAAVVLALGLTAALVSTGALGETALAIVGACGIVAAFVTSLVIDVRSGP
jgi:hypothetical protein